MPRNYSDPLTIKYLTEHFDNENEQRMVWFLKNKERIESSVLSKRNIQEHISPEDVTKLHIEKCIPILIAENKITTCNRRKKHLRDGPIICLSGIPKDKQLGLETNAKPVDPNISNILTKPLPEGGRLQYLKLRTRTLPEDKYETTQTTSQEYGWGYRDHWARFKVPEYGRIHRYYDDILCRTGPQPDPYHYIKVLRDNQCICLQ